MIILWWLITVMVIIALCFILYPLWRKNPLQKQILSQKNVNIQYYKQQLFDLQLAFKNNELDVESYQQQKIELEQAFYFDINEGENSITIKQEKNFFSSILIVIIFSLVAIVGYLLWGNSHDLKAYYQQASQRRGLEHFMQKFKSPQQVLLKMQEVVKENPNDAKGWFLLGRLQMGLQKFKAASKSFANANRLQKNDAETIFQYAQSLFKANNNRLNLKAKTLLRQASTLTPSDPRIVNLLALDAFYAKHYQQAIDYWTSIIQHYSITGKNAELLQQAIDKTRKLMNKKTNKSDAKHSQ